MWFYEINSVLNSELGTGNWEFEKKKPKIGLLDNIPYINSFSYSKNLVSPNPSFLISVFSFFTL